MAHSDFRISLYSGYISFPIKIGHHYTTARPLTMGLLYKQILGMLYSLM